MDHLYGGGLSANSLGCGQGAEDVEHGWVDGAGIVQEFSDNAL